MTKTRPNTLVAAALFAALCCGSAQAQSSENVNSFKIGYAGVRFNTNSGELTGPPGTTPPGVTADVKNTQTVALVYERKIRDRWSIVAQLGLPPTIEMLGAGNGAALGEVGTAKAYFPALLVTYSIDGLPGFQPYVGVGVNYTFFGSKQVNPGYTAAFGGTSSSAELKSSLGPVLKLGVEIPINKSWIVDFAYSRYWIKTSATIVTATPGLGNVERKINLTANPDVFGLAIGYRF